MSYAPEELKYAGVVLKVGSEWGKHGFGCLSADVGASFGEIKSAEKPRVGLTFSSAAVVMLAVDVLLSFFHNK